MVTGLERPSYGVCGCHFLLVPWAPGAFWIDAVLAVLVGFGDAPSVVFPGAPLSPATCRASPAHARRAAPCPPTAHRGAFLLLELFSSLVFLYGSLHHGENDPFVTSSPLTFHGLGTFTPPPTPSRRLSAPGAGVLPSSSAAGGHHCVRPPWSPLHLRDTWSGEGGARGLAC